MNYQEVIQNIITLDQMQAVSGAIDLIQNELVLEKNVKKKIIELFPILKNQEFDFANRQKVRGMLEDIKEVLHSSPIFHLIIASELQSQTLLEFAETLAKTYGRRIILSVSRDDSIIAGAVVEFAGYHKDYSVRKKLDEYYEKL